MTSDFSSMNFFKGLPDNVIDRILPLASQQKVLSGQTLIHEGDPSDCFYIVVSGRFKICVSEKDKRFTEVGPGHPIGEIGFFAGVMRTATVTAIRDCVVLKLTKSDFLSVCEKYPEIWQNLVANMANRLSETTHRSDEIETKPRTITLCQGGHAPLPESFYIQFKSVFTNGNSALFITFEDCKKKFGEDVIVNSSEVTNWLNKLERFHETVFFIADARMSDWTAKVIRQADNVFIVGMHEKNLSPGVIELNQIERCVFELHKPDAIRLILLHEDSGQINGSSSWLSNRKIHMHHHVGLDNLAHYRRLFRFVNGCAIGLVASGGGAYSAAHIGLYKALTEAGIEFDIMGGTSGGGAMTAAFALGIDVDEMDRLVNEIFVKNSALGRLTWPRYSILDHTVFDAQLREKYTDQDITDLWVNFFALSVNLVDGQVFLHRSGPIWEAVRATSSIPGLLPPFFTSDGKILIDGGVIDNVPLKSMKQIKSGPNIALCFAPKYDDDNPGFTYSSLPGRSKLITTMLNPFSKNKLPKAPGVGTVLMRSMVLNNSSFEQACTASDLQLIPELSRGIGLIDWQKHTMITNRAYEEGCRQLEELQKSKNETLMTIFNLLGK